MGACDSYNNTNKNRIKISNQINLEFILDNCFPNNKYQVQASLLKSGNAHFSSKTVLCQQNLITLGTYTCEYFFGKTQPMKINVLKNGISLGSFETDLGEIVGSPNCILRKIVSSGGPEFISISALGSSSSIIFDFKIKSNNYMNSDEMYFMVSTNDRKVLNESISQNGKFKPISIPTALLEPEFEVSFLNSSRENIANKKDNLASFIQQNNQEQVYLNFNHNNNSFKVYNKSQLNQQYSFIDYIKNGVQMTFSIGIDFTSQNAQESPSNPQKGAVAGSPKDIERAIRECGEIMSFYDYDQLFHVYGFGSTINNNQVKSNIFNINSETGQEIYTIDNVINEYRKRLNNISLIGPTLISPIIKNEIDMIRKENNLLIYHVLMILTYGEISDLDQIISTINTASSLPLSLIIIGIGNYDYKGIISSLRNNNSERKFIQIVKFNDCRNTGGLSGQALDKIPNKIIEYYLSLNIDSNTLKAGNIQNLTIKNYNNYNNQRNQPLY